MLLIAIILAFFVSTDENDIRVGTDNCHIGLATAPTTAAYALCYIEE